MEKVDTLKNVTYSLTKSVNTQKFSWCREYMGIDALNLQLYEYMTHFYAKKTTRGECWVYVIFFACACGGEVHMSALLQQGFLLATGAGMAPFCLQDRRVGSYMDNFENKNRM